MFYVTDTRSHKLVCKSRSISELVRLLTVQYPQIGLVETSAAVTLPRNLRLNYISR